MFFAGSGVARLCSQGGALVNRDACLTHFEGASRGCGVLLMGCQSLCRVQGMPCRTGRAWLAGSKAPLLLNPRMESVALQFVAVRVEGVNGPLMAKYRLRIFGNNGTQHAGAWDKGKVKKKGREEKEEKEKKGRGKK